jgi:nitroimidazol reductase NimA-like FMN-containing flavoprotein (pyridoxamine 5'-phosphate oxidase superfamily)
MESDRPHAPGYGFVGPDEGDGLLPFSWAEERLARSHNLWVHTTFPDGRPHAMPLWAVWVDGRVVFSTGRESRKAKNIANDPRVVVTTEDARQAVVVEGTAALVPMDDAFVAAYREKYDFDITTMADEPVFAVTPTRVIAIDEDRFTTSPTRFTL